MNRPDLGSSRAGSLPPVSNANVGKAKSLKAKDPALLRAERLSFDRQQQGQELPLLSRTAPLEARSRVKRIIVAAPPKNVYRYKHVPGNNGRVILFNFRKRPWWHSGNDKKGAKGGSTEGGSSQKSGGTKDSKTKETDSVKPTREVINFDVVIFIS